MISRIGFFTGLCWSASFVLAMLSLTQPSWGFAGNLLGVLSIWVAGVQLRAMQMSIPKEESHWGVRQRWHKSLQVQLLAALFCTFVQYVYFAMIVMIFIVVKNTNSPIGKFNVIINLKLILYISVSFEYVKLIIF